MTTHGQQAAWLGWAAGPASGLRLSPRAGFQDLEEQGLRDQEAAPSLVAPCTVESQWLWLGCWHMALAYSSLYAVVAES